MKRFTPVLIGIACFALPSLPASAQVSFGTASISADNASFLTGSSVLVSGLNWTLDLPNFTVNPFETGTVDITIPISVTVPGTHEITGETYYFAGSADGSAFGSVQEAITSGTGDTASTSFTLLPPNTKGASLTLPQGFQKGFLVTEITLGDGTQSGFSSLNQVRHTLAAPVVPEPSSLVGLGLGISLLALCVRRRYNRKDSLTPRDLERNFHA